MVMKPFSLTQDDLWTAAQYLRELATALDIVQRDCITYHKELRELRAENKWLTEELGRKYEGDTLPTEGNGDT
jgi:hypothetical protein